MAQLSNRPAVLLTLPERAYLALNVAKLDADAAAVLVAISERESGGWSNAYRPASKNPGGGNDRGVLQFNSKAYPNISDDEAFDPVRAFARAGSIIKAKERGGREGFGPWDIGPNAYSGNPKQIDTSAAANAVRSPIDPSPKLVAKGLTGAGNAIAAGFDIPGPFDDWAKSGVDALPNPLDVGGDIVSAIVAVFQPVGDAFATIGRLFANLVDPGWWRRIGVGALGIGLILAAIVWMNRQAITSAIPAGRAAKAAGAIK